MATRYQRVSAAALYQLLALIASLLDGVAVIPRSRLESMLVGEECFIGLIRRYDCTDRRRVLADKSIVGPGERARYENLGKKSKKRRSVRRR